MPRAPLFGVTFPEQCASLGDSAHTLDTRGIELPSSFTGPMGDFLASIEDGTEPEVSARRNLATIRQVMAEHRSAVAGGTWQDV